MSLAWSLNAREMWKVQTLHLLSLYFPDSTSWNTLIIDNQRRWAPQSPQPGVISHGCPTSLRTGCTTKSSASKSSQWESTFSWFLAEDYKPVLNEKRRSENGIFKSHSKRDEVIPVNLGHLKNSGRRFHLIERSHQKSSSDTFCFSLLPFQRRTPHPCATVASHALR